MKRLALVLTVAALAAVSCTTPGAVPATTTSSSTTQAGASAREAYMPSYELIDPAYYPSGSLLVTTVPEVSLVEGVVCPALYTNLNELVPGSVNCDLSTARGGYVESTPVPLSAVGAYVGGLYALKDYTPPFGPSVLAGERVFSVNYNLRIRW